MRDKYNLNTLPPGMEEDYGNIGDGVKGKHGDGSKVGVNIPGMAPEDRVESAMVIPGLDFSHSPADLQSIAEKKKQPFSKPIPKSFQANWNTDGAGDGERGVKRSYDGGRGPAGAQENSRKENQPPPAPPIPLATLQQQATAIVAKGQIIPILPASPLYLSLINGENSLKDILVRELNIGSQNSFSLPQVSGAGPPSNFNSNQMQGQGGQDWTRASKLVGLARRQGPPGRLENLRLDKSGPAPASPNLASKSLRDCQFGALRGTTATPYAGGTKKR